MRRAGLCGCDAPGQRPHAAADGVQKGRADVCLKLKTCSSSAAAAAAGKRLQPRESGVPRRGVISPACPRASWRLGGARAGRARARQLDGRGCLAGLEGVPRSATRHSESGWVDSQSRATVNRGPSCGQRLSSGARILLGARTHARSVTGETACRCRPATARGLSASRPQASGLAKQTHVHVRPRKGVPLPWANARCAPALVSSCVGGAWYRAAARQARNWRAVAAGGDAAGHIVVESQRGDAHKGLPTVAMTRALLTPQADAGPHLAVYTHSYNLCCQLRGVVNAAAATRGLPPLALSC